MISLLAGLLRSLFPALVLGFAVIVLAFAGLYGLASGNLLMAAVLAVAGLMMVLLVFGLLALHIETHTLLAQMARSPQTAHAAAQGAAGLGLRRADMGRQELTRPEMARPEPGRREPVVTLRPHAQYEPI